MSTPTTPAALLNELAILRRQNKQLADRLDTRKGERRRLIVERTIDRAFLDACALYTLAVAGADVGREYAPLPQRRWAKAAALLRLAGLTDGGRYLHLRMINPEEAMRRLTEAAAEAKATPRRLGAYLADFVRPASLR